MNEMRSPYIIRMTDHGIDTRFDPGSVNGADNSEMIAKLLGYSVLYRGVVYNDKEFELVSNGIRYANESRKVGRFNPRVLEEILPNLISRPGVVE